MACSRAAVLPSAAHAEPGNPGYFAAGPAPNAACGTRCSGIKDTQELPIRIHEEGRGSTSQEDQSSLPPPPRKHDAFRFLSEPRRRKSAPCPPGPWPSPWPWPWLGQKNGEAMFRCLLKLHSVLGGSACLFSLSARRFMAIIPIVYMAGGMSICEMHWNGWQALIRTGPCATLARPFSSQAGCEYHLSDLIATCRLPSLENPSTRLPGVGYDPNASHKTWKAMLHPSFRGGTVL